MSENKQKTYGIIAEFGNSGALIEAAKKIRDSGYEKFDCHSPFPIHGMDKAMGIGRSPLGYIIAIIAFAAMCGGLLLQYWTNAVDYPYVISGKPFASYQTYAPVGFAITVLTSAICTFIIMLALNGLPRLHNPLFFSNRFAKATDDGFFVSIEKDDPKFDASKIKKFLESIGGNNIELLQD